MPNIGWWYALKKKILVDEEILLCAFRYALGRKTYMVGWVAETIEEHWGALSEKYHELIKREIKEAPDLGMDCDQKDWEHILQLGD